MFEQRGPAMGTLKVRYSFKMLLNGLFQKKSTPPAGPMMEGTVF